MSTKRAPLVCHGHSRPIVELQFSPITPDGYFLVSASKDGAPMLRNGETGDWIGTFEGHKGAVWSTDINDSATVVATGSADFTARVWDAITGDEKHNFKHSHIVRTVAFAHKHDQLVTGGHEKLIRIFDLQRPDADPEQLPACGQSIRCLSWIQEDCLLLSSCADVPNVSVWDVRSKEVVHTLPTSGPVTSIRMSYDGRYVTTADGRSVRIWDTAALALLKEFPISGYQVEAAAYCPTKRMFAAGGTDMWVHLYSYDTGKELDCCKGHHGPVHTITFAPTANAYASGSEDGTIRIWPMPQDGAAAAQ